MQNKTGSGRARIYLFGAGTLSQDKKAVWSMETVGAEMRRGTDDGRCALSVLFRLGSSFHKVNRNKRDNTLRLVHSHFEHGHVFGFAAAQV
jgi:hypothetical protein